MINKSSAQNATARICKRPKMPMALTSRKSCSKLVARIDPRLFRIHREQITHLTRGEQIMLRIVLAALHLLALGIGLFAVVYRGSALREAITESSLKRAFRFDALWGIAAGLWIATGLWRFLGSIEKPMTYYENNSLFRVKMGALLLILLLEVWPMITLIGWRKQMRKAAAPAAIVSVNTAKRVATISHVQALLVVIMVFAAAGMARG